MPLCKDLTAIEVDVGKTDTSVASIEERARNAALKEIAVAGTVVREVSVDGDRDDLVPA